MMSICGLRVVEWPAGSVPRGWSRCTGDTILLTGAELSRAACFDSEMLKQIIRWKRSSSE